MSTTTTITDRSFKGKAYKTISAITEWSLLALLVVLTFSIALSEIFIVVALVSWLFKKVLDRDFSFIKNPVYLVLTVYIAFIGLSVANSEFFYISFRGMIKAVKGIAVFLILIDTFRTREQILRVIKILIVLFLFVSLNGIWQYWFGKDLLRGKEVGYFEDFRRRISSSFSYYSQFGSFLTLFNSFFLALLIGNNSLKKKEKVLLLLLVFLGVFMFFFSGSRASWLSFGASALFLGIVYRNKIILFGLLIVGLLIPFVVPNYMLIHFDKDRKEQSISERIMLWHRAVDVIKAHPFLGCGINTYSLVHAKYDTVKDTRVKGYYAHNGYLQLAAEIGLFGLGFFLLFLFLFFGHILWLARNIPDPLYANISLGFLAGCFGFLVLIIFDTDLQSLQSSTFFWMFMGFSMASLRLGLSNQVEQKSNKEILS